MDDSIKVDTLNISWDDLKSDTAQVGDVICIRGYIGNPGNYINITNGKMTVPIFERRNQQAGFRIQLSIPTGTEPNHVHDLPEEFLPEDFKIVSASNEILSIGNYVFITARIQSDDVTKSACYAEIISIEKADNIDQIPALDKAIELTDEILFDTSVHALFCFFDAKIVLPELIFSYTNQITLELKDCSLDSISTLAIPIGDKPGTMHDLPDNYTEDDLYILDIHAVKLPYNKLIRIYGTWERFTFDSSFPGSFYVEEFEVRI
ncbi:MAG: hypothetical protein IPM74_13705 [Crocinitomicaceae bacterium]|nr:hypothetical protein [Crocinitomicaceae bacterium]MBK8926930.1 hypothetical protein [Crocinitomicaceae bacterium]